VAGRFAKTSRVVCVFSNRALEIACGPASEAGWNPVLAQAHVRVHPEWSSARRRVQRSSVARALRFHRLAPE
jgi:hypothetical protein